MLMVANPSVPPVALMSFSTSTDPRGENKVSFSVLLEGPPLSKVRILRLPPTGLHGAGPQPLSATLADPSGATPEV